MLQCEYFLVEYVPSPRGQLRLPIGLVLLEESGRLVRFGMTRHWNAVRCLDPRADLRMLDALSAWIEQFVSEYSASRVEAEGENLRSAFLEMTQRNLGTVHLAPPQGVETDDPQREFDLLFGEHVERPRAVAARPVPRAGNRRWIQARLREALAQHQILNRLRHSVPVEEFTAPGDDFCIDYGYRPNGITKYLHALSLERDWNQCKVLSYTFGRIRERGPATLTAVVADTDPELPRALSGRKILADSDIAIQPLAGLDSLLAKISLELGPVA